MINEELRTKLNAPHYTDKELRLARLLEPNPEHLSGGGGDSTKGLWHYEFFSRYYIETRDIVDDDTPGWLPHYTTRDMNAALRAEGALPESLRSAYLYALRDIIGSAWRAALDPDETRFRMVETYWLFRRATPEQIVDALLATLEAQPKQT